MKSARPHHRVRRHRCQPVRGFLVRKGTPPRPIKFCTICGKREKK